MAEKAKSETRVLYEKLMDTQPDFRIKGKASAYTSLNGHMFSFITKEGGLAIRLSPEDQHAFQKKHRSGPVIQHNSTMRGYVHVPESLLKRTSAAAKVLQASIDHIRSLDPKPTAKSKTKADSRKKVAQKKAEKKKATKKKASKQGATKKTASKKKKSTATKQAAAKKAAGKKVSPKKTKSAASTKASKVRKAVKKKAAKKAAGAKKKASQKPGKAKTKPKKKAAAAK
ncbi:MAG: hypothetical protein P1V35_09695 [Planctomycetota bacterium]|nr:hypothetical protein [Planctomycetota bacterium]